MFGTHEDFEYFRCENCGCLQICQYPSNIENYYKNHYYSYCSTSNKISTKDHIINILKKKRNAYLFGDFNIPGYILSQLKSKELVVNLYNCISSMLMSANDLKVLDVGCGAGEFLNLLHDLGLKNLHGVDPFVSSEILDDARFKIMKSEIFEIHQHYDLIFFNHSLEHMTNQKAVMDKAAKLLNDGGRIIIRLPLIDSYAWDVYGVNWVQLDAPRHFYLHTKKSLTLLAQKYGLECVEIKYDSTGFQLWGSELYNKNIQLFDKDTNLPNSKLFTKWQLYNFNNYAKKLNAANIGDQAMFTFKRFAQ